MSSGVSSLVRRTAGNSVVVAGAEVLGKLATLVWTLLAVRELEVDRFGALVFVLSTALLVSALADWGFDAVLVRRGSAEPAKLSSLLTVAIAWQLGLGLVVFTVTGVALAASRTDTTFRVMVALVLGAVLLDVLSDSCRAAGAARQRQRPTSTALVLQRIATAALICVALLLGWDLIGVGAALLVGATLGLAAHLIALRSLEVRLVRGALTRRQLGEFARGTAMLGLSVLTLMVLFRADAFLLGALRGDEEVAAYATAYRLLETVLFIAFAVRSSVFPVMSAAPDAARVSAAFQGAVAALGLVYVPYAVVAVWEGDRVLGLLFGQRYEVVAAPALAALAAAPLLFALAYLASAALQTTGRTGGLLAASVAAVTVNVSLNLALIPRYGATAAGAVTTASYLVQAGTLLLMVRRAGIATRVTRALAEPLVAAVPLLAALVLLRLPLLVELPLAAAVYGGTWLLLVRRTDPRQLAVLRSLLRRSA